MTFLHFIVSFICAWASSHYAEKRGRNELAWFVFGALFGILSLIALFLLPAAKAKKSSREMEIKPLSVVKEEIHPENGWHYMDKNHEQQGPISIDRLRKLIQGKEIFNKTYVWQEKFKDWQTLDSLDPQI